MKKSLFLLTFAAFCLVSCGNEGVSSSLMSSFSSEAIVPHLELSGNYQTSFEIADDFSTEGIVVSLVEEGLTSDVTEDCDFSSPDMTVLGDQKITVTYGDFVTAYSITINDKTCAGYNVSLGQLYEFKNTLDAMGGHVATSHIETTIGTYYLTEGDPFVMISASAHDDTRYEDIVISKGTYAFVDEDGIPSSLTSFEAQTFYDDKNYYQIVDYESGDWEDSKKTIAKTYYPDPGDVLDLDFPNAFSSTIDIMIRAFGNKYYTCQCEGLSYQEGASAWEFSIVMSALNDNLKNPDETISYKAKLSIDGNDYISAASTEMEDDLFAGGVKANWRITYGEASYTQGDWGDYTGERFDPADYTESSTSA